MIKERECGGENLAVILGEDNAIIGYQMCDDANEQKVCRRMAVLAGSAQQRNGLGMRLGGAFEDPPSASGIYAERVGGIERQTRDQRAFSREFEQQVIAILKEQNIAGWRMVGRTNSQANLSAE